MQLDDARILITGGSQGIGRHLAVHFATRSAKVTIAARNESGLKETQSLVAEGGGVCDYAVLDLSDAASVEALADTMTRDGAGVDILINNAADVTSKPLLETSPSEIAHTIESNLTGPLHLTRRLLPGMIERGRGMIINVSSLAGYKPNPSQTVYSISKYAVNGMSEALRNELRGTGVEVMNVALGSIALAGSGETSGVPVAEFAQRLERAILAGTPELFLSPVSKWLMRVYHFCPPLARWTT